MTDDCYADAVRKIVNDFATAFDNNDSAAPAWTDADTTAAGSAALSMLKEIAPSWRTIESYGSLQAIGLIDMDIGICVKILEDARAELRKLANMLIEHKKHAREVEVELQTIIGG